LIETLKMKKKMDGELVKQNKKKLAKTMSFGKIDWLYYYQIWSKYYHL